METRALEPSYRFGYDSQPSADLAAFIFFAERLARKGLRTARINRRLGSRGHSRVHPSGGGEAHLIDKERPHAIRAREREEVFLESRPTRIHHR